MERDSERQRVGVTERGQSVFDFSIGITLFLVVVLGVVVFVPTAFGALSDDSEADDEDALAAERVADHLVETTLSPSDASIELDRFCTLAYFGDGAICGFESGNSLAADSGRAPSQPLNVTIEYDRDDDGTRERLCWDDDVPGSVVHASSGDCDTAFTAGPSAKRNQNYVTATRLARFEGEDVFIVVRTW